MLEEYKQACYDNANLIPNWKLIDRNDLCRRYVAEKKAGNVELADSYLSAILYKFWNVTEHNYYSQSYKKATEGDCIDWTVTGILYALDRHVWDDPSNTLYNDPKGPEKAINVCIYSTKVNFYQKIKHYKERAYYESFSLESLLEDSSEAYYIPVCDEDNAVYNFINSLIKKAFSERNYLKAFVLDMILNNNVFDDKLEDGAVFLCFNEKKLRHLLRSMDQVYCKRFVHMYGVPIAEVRNCIQKVINLPYNRLKKEVSAILNGLRCDKQVVSYLSR